MSFRTWLGEGRKDWADYNACDYPSLAELCCQAAWKLPARVYAPDVRHMEAFLHVMKTEHFMDEPEFWDLCIGDDGHWSCRQASQGRNATA